MAKSLQEQLMGAGLVDKKRAKQIHKEKQKKKKQQPKGFVVEDENAKRLQQEKIQKAEKDRQLNQEIKAKADAKAIQAQIKQLIEKSRIAKGEGDIGFQFVDGTLIRKVFVDETQQSLLVKGLIRIAKLGDDYELVPAKVAQKIEERDQDSVIPASSAEEVPAEDDPYADYKIPDDLMW